MDLKGLTSCFDFDIMDIRPISLARVIAEEDRFFLTLKKTARMYQVSVDLKEGFFELCGPFGTREVNFNDLNLFYTDKGRIFNMQRAISDYFIDLFNEIGVDYSDTDYSMPGGIGI